MNTITNTHANDVVLFERRVPVSQLGTSFHGQRPGIPVLGSTALVERYNEAGEPVDVPLPVDLHISEQAYPNDVVATENGNTFVYRGSYWIDSVETDPETGEEIAVLHLGQQVRCDEVDWCTGHRWIGQNTIDPDDVHMGNLTEVWAFGNVQMRVGRRCEIGSTEIKFELYVDTDDSREPDVSLTEYADAFEGAAKRLREVAASE